MIQPNILIYTKLLYEVLKMGQSQNQTIKVTITMKVYQKICQIWGASVPLQKDTVCALWRSLYPIPLSTSLFSGTFEGIYGKLNSNDYFYSLTNDIPLKSENIQEMGSLPWTKSFNAEFKIFLDSKKKFYSLLLECDYQQFSDLQRETWVNSLELPKKAKNIYIYTHTHKS